MPPKRRFQPPRPDSFLPGPFPAPADAPSSQRRRPNIRSTFDSFMTLSNNVSVQSNTEDLPAPYNLQQRYRRKPATKPQLDPELLPKNKQEEKEEDEDMILPSSTPIQAESPKRQDKTATYIEGAVIPASDAPSSSLQDSHEDATLPVSPARTLTIGPFTPKRPQRGVCTMDAILIPDSSPLQFRTPTKRSLHRTASGVDSIQSPSDMSSPFRFPSNNPTPKRIRPSWFEDINDEEGGDEYDSDLLSPHPPTPFKKRLLAPSQKTPVPKASPFTFTPARPREPTLEEEEEVYSSDSCDTVRLPSAKRARLKHEGSIEESQDTLAHVKLESDGFGGVIDRRTREEDDEEESQETAGLLTDPLGLPTSPHSRTSIPPNKFTPSSNQWTRFTVPTSTPTPCLQVKRQPLAVPKPPPRKFHKVESPVRTIRILAIGDSFPDGGRLVWGFFELGARTEEEKKGGAIILSCEGASRSEMLRVGGRVGLFGVGWKVMVRLGRWWKVKGRWMPLKDESNEEHTREYEPKGEKWTGENVRVKMPEVDFEGYGTGGLLPEIDELKEEVGADLPAVEEVNEEYEERGL